jgi:DNA-directed RNA polymerase subunit M/transcription elongation factor TFIIS
MDIIYKPKDNLTDSSVKYYMKMQNTIIPLMEFFFLKEPSRSIDLNNVQMSQENCTHIFEEIEMIQTRSADESFTSIYMCTKCYIKRTRN